MESTVDLFLYPFERIEFFLDKQLSPKLDKFYAGYLNEYIDIPVKSVDKDKHIIVFYNYADDGKPDDRVIRFEDNIKYHLSNLIKDSINTIKNGINHCHSSNQSVFRYLDKVELNYNQLIDNKRIEEFPFLLKYLKVIKTKVDAYRPKSNKDFKPLSPSASPFKIKNGVKADFFESIYYIAIDYDLISANLLENEFYEVLTEAQTDKTIDFICDNSLMRAYLKGIQPVFYKLDGPTIDKSKRFKTKQGKFITASTFYNGGRSFKFEEQIDEIEDKISFLVEGIS